MFERKRILFFVPGDSVYDSAIFKTQVLDFARWLSNEGASCLVVNSASRNADTSTLHDVWEDEGRLHLINDVRDDKHYWFFRAIDKFRLVLKRVLPTVREFAPTHVYVRDYVQYWAIAKEARTLGATIVFSVRGAAIEEQLARSGLRRFVLAAYTWWKFGGAVRDCDQLTCVSKALSAYLFKRFGRAASVLPCCTTVNAATLAQKHTHKTIVYAGGLYAWQNAGEMMQLLKAILDADASIRAKILTPNLEIFEATCKRLGIDRKRCVGLTCNAEAVAAELQDSDVGILLRQDNIINNVACPTKMAEYLASGLGLIISPCIGDVMDVFKDSPVVFFYRPGDSINRVLEFVNGISIDNKYQAVELARKYYTLEGNLGVIKHMFG